MSAWYPPRFSDMFIDHNSSSNNNTTTDTNSTNTTDTTNNTNSSTTATTTATTTTTTNVSQPSPRHWKWDKGDLSYLVTNRWALNISKEMKENCRRHTIYGVIVKDLAPNHPLYGEQGLYATKKFEKFDVIGEYLGKIVGPEIKCGHYLAALEDKEHEDSLGLDADKCGNEMRFINSYINVDFTPNVTMRTVYMNTYPHLVIVATKDIESGDEILLDYGAAYNNLYILKQEEEKKKVELDYSLVKQALPGLATPSDSDDDNDDNKKDSDDDNNNDDNKKEN